MLSIRLAAPIVAVTALLLGVPGQASARVDGRPSLQRTADGVGDMKKVITRDGHERIVAAPRQRLGDIVSIKVWHREHAVVIRVRTARLRPADPFYGATFEIRTGDHSYAAAILAAKSTPQGTAYLFANDDRRPCKGLSHRMAFGRDLISIRIPRACLGKPDWVRTRAAVVYGHRTFDYFVDVAPGRALKSSLFLRRAWYPGA